MVSRNAAETVMGIKHEFAVITILRKPVRVAAHDVVASRGAERIINIFRHSRRNIIHIHRAFALIDVRAAVDDVFTVFHVEAKNKIAAVTQVVTEAIFAVFLKEGPHRRFFTEIFQHFQELF